MHKQAGNGALHAREGTNYLATGVQTGRDDEAYTAWNSERTRWAEEKVALQSEAETLRGEKARALADVDFFREQYQRASDFASTTRSENDELAARAALAESQAANGVALVRTTFKMRAVKLEAELQKYKALSELLTERARRTDDTVRYRAARALELDVELRNLRGEFREMEAELEETMDELRAKRRVNAGLRRRLASLEQAPDADAGTSAGQELMLGSEEKGDEDYHPSNSPPSSPRGGSDGSPPRHGSPRDEDGARPADGEIEELTYLDESAQSSNDDMVYLCRWRSGEPAGCCDAVMNTKQVIEILPGCLRDVGLISFLGTK
jgi:predicted  nucleic acid-binding Zn-ribbon protein